MSDQEQSTFGQADAKGLFSFLRDHSLGVAAAVATISEIFGKDSEGTTEAG